MVRFRTIDLKSHPIAQFTKNRIITIIHLTYETNALTDKAKPLTDEADALTDEPNVLTDTCKTNVLMDP